MESAGLRNLVCREENPIVLLFNDRKSTRYPLCDIKPKLEPGARLNQPTKHSYPWLPTFYRSPFLHSPFLILAAHIIKQKVSEKGFLHHNQRQHQTFLPHPLIPQNWICKSSSPNNRRFDIAVPNICLILTSVAAVLAFFERPCFAKDCYC